ncbi:MAG TPA: IS481 family transposase [Solirubrobacteraceae bacterium]|jgi:transposase InsO family protein|nr:IS481 family transposase [Solirubrobacteraceae bacterium]
MARYLVEAHVLGGRPVSELAAAHGVHRSWLYKLIARYKHGGYQALQPRSRRPRSCKHQTPTEIVEKIVKLREQLVREGHDAGAATIAYHLRAEMTDGAPTPSVSTIWRIIRREGLVVPQPQKRPHSSLIRFEAELPNEMWQTDITHWQLKDEQHVEILNMIDDHSRLFLASQAFLTIKAQDVVNVFQQAASLHGLPACLLSDNGAVFTATPRKGKVLLQTELERLGIASKNSRPYHPQTCGKIERLHQTLKRYLARQQPASTLAELQAQLDAFAHYYNTRRPHRALDGRTPLQAYSARLKARPANQTATPASHYRVRQDKVDKTGRVTLRHNSRLHHIGIGRAHKGRTIKLLIADRDIRIIDHQTGELLRQLTLDPNRDYQPINKT